MVRLNQHFRSVSSAQLVIPGTVVAIRPLQGVLSMVKMENG